MLQVASCKLYHSELGQRNELHRILNTRGPLGDQRSDRGH